MHSKSEIKIKIKIGFVTRHWEFKPIELNLNVQNKKILVSF